MSEKPDSKTIKYVSIRKGNTGPAAEEGSDSSCSSQTVDIFRTVFGARTGYTRAVLLLLMTIMLLYVGCNGKSGEETNLGLTLLTSSGGRELPLH